MRNLLIALFIMASQPIFAQDDIVQIGQTMPKFSITDSSNKEIFSESFSNKIVLINFFATWCGPCLAELPYLQNEIWEKYKDNKNFSLLVIGRDHSVAEVNEFIKTKNFTFPMYADTGKIVYSMFATKYIPRNYLIDATGKVVYKSQGFEKSDFKELKAKLEKMLN